MKIILLLLWIFLLFTSCSKNLNWKTIMIPITVDFEWDWLEWRYIVGDEEEFEIRTLKTKNIWNSIEVINEWNLNGLKILYWTGSENIYNNIKIKTIKNDNINLINNNIIKVSDIFFFEKVNTNLNVNILNKAHWITFIKNIFWSNSKLLTPLIKIPEWRSRYEISLYTYWESWWHSEWKKWSPIMTGFKVLEYENNNIIISYNINYANYNRLYFIWIRPEVKWNIINN